MPAIAKSPWIDEARAQAAQCWCCEDTSHLVMEPALADAVARAIAGWMETGAEMARNVEFYRGLLDQCVPHLGPEVFVCDDGSRSQEPLRLKIPDLVAALSARIAALEGQITEMRTELDQVSRNSVFGGSGC